MKMTNKEVLGHASKVVEYVEKELGVTDDIVKTAILDTASEGIRRTLQAKSFEDILKVSFHKLINDK